MTTDTKEIRIVQNDVSDDFKHFVKKHKPLTAIDIETDGLDKRGNIGAITVYAANYGVEIVHHPRRELWNLKSIAADQHIRKVIHYAPFDMGFLYTWGGVYFTNVACTRAGGVILDPKREYSHSLAPMLERYLGVTIAKGEALSNWFAPTLTDNQVRYAAEDVCYLPALLERLESDLMYVGDLQIYRDACAYLPTRTYLESFGIRDVHGRA